MSPVWFEGNPWKCITKFVQGQGYLISPTASPYNASPHCQRDIHSGYHVGHPLTSHLSHKSTERRVGRCGQTGPSEQWEKATHCGKACRSLRGYFHGLCLSGLQTVIGYGKKWCRCPDKRAQVMEEGKDEKQYLSYHKHICSFFGDSGGSCKTTAGQVHRHSQCP